MIKFLKKPIVIAIILLLIANVAIFWQFYFKHLIPFPGNLLVSFYFPWNSGGFAGFDPWTTRKDVTSMDAVRMMYPWKTLAFDIIKSGHWPLWNPYNFSGMPLVGDFQSSIFFPVNVLFLLLPYLTAWITMVISLPFLFSFFIYLFLRSCKLSNLASIFGAIVLSNISYLVMWSELVVMLQCVVFLPLILWAINKHVETKRLIYVWIIPLLLAFSVLGGHPQTFIYTYSISFAYALFKQVNFKLLALVYIFSGVLSAVQLLPSWELFQTIARDGQLTRSFVIQTALPWKNLITILAPDFFGNPSTGNFRGNNYDNSLAYFGVVALVFALYAILKWIKNREVLFWLIIGLLGLIFSLPPFAYAVFYLHVPVLSTGYLSRADFYFEFSMAILAAFGLDAFLKEGFQIKAKSWLPYILIGGLYAVLIAFTKLAKTTDTLISFKNLLLPAALFFATLGTLIFFGRNKTNRKILSTIAIIIIILAIFEHSYFFNKYQPFSEIKFVFPSHPVFDFLKNNAGFDRFYGMDTAYIDNNFASYYRVYSPEGYDPMFIRRYARLLSASDTGGQYGEILSDHDAFVSKTSGQDRDRLLDLLGVKYIIDKTDDPEHDLGPNLNKFPLSKYSFVTQINKWKFYTRKTVLPRAYLVGKYSLRPKKQDAISTIYNPQWDPKNDVVLDNDPHLKLTADPLSWAKIDKYEPSDLTIETQTRTPQLLVLSDSYFPGWNAYVDGKQIPILKANYALRAVPVRPGHHIVTMNYDPDSFRFGLWITLGSGAVWLIVLSLIFKKSLSAKQHK